VESTTTKYEQYIQKQREILDYMEIGLRKIRRDY
jgi:hypothetical protein